MHDPIPDLWNDADCAGMTEPELLLYRSNLLGSDLRITNFGGGNTSAKTSGTDPLTGEGVEVLWVKGSGGDLGSNPAVIQGDDRSEGLPARVNRELCKRLRRDRDSLRLNGRC